MSMQLELKNIGIIREGSIILDGLTVIAGENDTGKSTVGKILYAMIKADNITRKKNQRNVIESKEKTLKQVLSLVFDNYNFKKSMAVLKDSSDTTIYNMEIDKNGRIHFITENSPFLDTTFIESPMIWNMIDFFSTVEKIKTEDDMFGIGFEVKYPYILWDLYRKLMVKKNFSRACEDGSVDVSDKIQKIIKGRFEKVGEQLVFKKTSLNNANIPLFNTASGIKSFGILQILFENTHINPKSLLIFDEPEVHLHPKWEIDFAQIISLFVESGVKVIVNTHSPYMVQALRTFCKGQNANFYLAEKDAKEYSVVNNVTQDISQIFKKLSDPLQELVWRN